MMTYLTVSVWEPNAENNCSDRVLVSATVWESFDREHTGNGPIFVEVGPVGSGVVGRICPAVPADGLPEDSCRMPHWMWMRIGAPVGSDEDCWIAINSCALPVAGTLTLRPRTRATLLELPDPVETLSACLSGQHGPSWACLSEGAELPLHCGIFDIMEIRSVEGIPVPAATILDTDVNLELMPALDEPPPVVRPPTPIPAAPEALVTTGGSESTHSSRGISGRGGSAGFVPFSGTGRRLCDP
jgi:hypothetical protein